MTWREAIEKVLKDAGTPLHYTKITERILTEKLRTNEGATPSRTVSATLINEAHKEVFERIAPGVFRLRGVSNLDDEEEKSDNDSDRPIMALGMFWERDLVDWTKKKAEDSWGRANRRRPCRYGKPDRSLPVA